MIAKRGETILVVVAALVGVQIIAAIPGCPSDLRSTSLMSVHNERCYQFVGEERFWTGARDYCIQHGGRLVKIDDPQTNDFIVQTLINLWWRNKGIWIGLNDRNLESRWQWMGSLPFTSEPLNWANWGSGHPSAFLHGMRDCVRMVRGTGDWFWHETPCNLLNWQYRFICEYERVPTTSQLPVTKGFVLRAANHQGAQPDSAEHRVHQLATDNQEDVDSSFVAAHEAVLQQEQVPAANNNWYVAVIIIAAATILLVVGLLLWRRRGGYYNKLAARVSSMPDCGSLKEAESNEAPKECVSDKETSSSNFRKAQANIYVTSKISLPDENVYEDVESPIRSHDVKIKSDSSTHTNPEEAVTADECKQLPEYSNCPLDIEEEMQKYENGTNDCGTINYDMPKLTNLYSKKKKVPTATLR